MSWPLIFLTAAVGPVLQAGSYSVGSTSDEGFLFTGNSGRNPAATLFLLPSMAVTLIVATVAIPSLLRSRQAANEASAVANLRTIAAAEGAYSSSSRGNYADLPTLVRAGLLDSRFTSAVSGYQYTITVSRESQKNCWRSKPPVIVDVPKTGSSDMNRCPST